CLFTLIVSTAEACATLAADCVNFIDENDTRCVFLSVFEQITNSGSPDTDEHLNKIRTTDREERNACFSGNSTSQEGFTGTRRSDKQNTFWNAGADVCESARIFQEINNFYKFLFLFICSSYIAKTDFLFLI